jgi:predicted lipoprotein with Yx(FWY)xxD motif
MKRTLILLGAIALLALAACGSDDGGSEAATVSMDNGVLVDSNGAPLYTTDQEQRGKVACTGGCTAVWLPLDAAGEPTAGDGVSGKLGTVKRPDGGRQVTLDGRPLYRFAEDGEDGKATGDGLTDSFGGRQFTWQAVGDAEGGEGGGGGTYSY